MKFLCWYEHNDNKNNKDNCGLRSARASAVKIKVKQQLAFKVNQKWADWADLGTIQRASPVNCFSNINDNNNKNNNTD